MQHQRSTATIDVDPDDFYDDRCALCGTQARFVRNRRALGAAYQCPSCKASLRYQNQARVLVERYARHGATSFAELAREPEFADLRILEPGTLGPFRAHLRRLPGYEQTVYVADTPGGAVVDGLRCEDLMALTYPSEIVDLVITSDVFEHVRHPEVAFREVHRVLRPGGAHVFTVPVRWPIRPETIPRVDTSGSEDVFLTDPEYHNGNLVYNDFGMDLVDVLDEIGFDTTITRFESTNRNAARIVAFCSVKRPGPDRIGDARLGEPAAAEHAGPAERGAAPGSDLRPGPGGVGAGAVAVTRRAGAAALAAGRRFARIRSRRRQ